VARSSTDCGTFRSSARAAPERRDIHPVAKQAATGRDLGEPDCGQPVLARQLRDARGSGDEHGVVGDNQSLGTALGQGRESLRVVRGAPDLDRLKPELGRSGRLLHGTDQPRIHRTVAHYHHAHALDVRQQILEQLQPLGVQLAEEVGRAGHVLAGPREARNQSLLGGIASGRHDDGDRTRRPLGGRHARTGGDQHVGPQLHQLRRQIGKPRRLALRPAHVDGEVRAFDVAELAQAGAERRQLGRVFGRRGDAEEPDSYRFPRLRQRAGWQRRGKRARAQTQNHRAPRRHSITRSARRRMDCGIETPIARAAR